MDHIECNLALKAKARRLGLIIGETLLMQTRMTIDTFGPNSLVLIFYMVVYHLIVSLYTLFGPPLCNDLKKVTHLTID